MADSKSPRADGTIGRTREGGFVKKALLITAIAAFLFLLAGNVLRYIGFSPLPISIVTQLGHMDTVGKNVQILVGRAKADNAPESLTTVRAEYEDVEGSFNQALQRVHDELNLDALNPDDLQSTLQLLENSEVALRDHLLPLSQQIAKADMGAILEFLWKLVEAGATSWGDLIKDKGEKKRVATDMLERMRWPDWDKIPKRSMLEG